MKYLIVIFLRFFCSLIIFLIFNSLPVISQNRFEGIIQYQISNSGKKQVNIPRETTYYLKDQNLMLRVFTETGDELVRILLIGDNRMMYMIDDIQKSAVKLQFMDENENEPGVIPEQYKEAYQEAMNNQKNKKQQLQPTMEVTGASENIAGYRCKKYRIAYKDWQQNSETFIWLSEDIHFDLPDNLMTGNNPIFQFLGTAGFPLKLTMTSGNELMEMVATKVERKRLNNELFTIPSDYTISDMTSFINGR